MPGLTGKRVALREFLVFDELIRERLLSTPLSQITQVTRRLLQEYGQPLSVEC